MFRIDIFYQKRYLLLVTISVRLTAPRCRYHDRQDISGRLLTFSGWSRRGFSFYTMVYISTTLALVGSERQLRLNVFCEVQQEMWLWSAGRWFQTAWKSRWLHTTTLTLVGSKRTHLLVNGTGNSLILLLSWSCHLSKVIHRPPKLLHVGRHFIIRLLLFFFSTNCTT